MTLAAPSLSWHTDDAALLHGLGKDEFNGKLVTLRGRDPKNPERWSVEVLGGDGDALSGKKFSVKPQNLITPRQAIEPAAKRARPEQFPTTALEPPLPPPSQGAGPSASEACKEPCVHEACVKRRLMAVLPPLSATGWQGRRSWTQLQGRWVLPKEPDPERLFDAHSVPAMHPEAHLRIATWNLLVTVGSANDPRGLHAVFDVRRMNVLRLLLALDADVVIFQELCDKSRDFLRATVVTHTLVGNFLVRTTPHARRGVRLELLKDKATVAEIHRNDKAHKRKGSNVTYGPQGYLAHLPVRVHGLADGSAARDLVLGASHIAVFRPSASLPAMTSVDHEAGVFVGAIGRALLRLPARYGAPLVHGGDFNAVKHLGTSGGVYAQLTQRRVLRQQGEDVDSADEWDEDADEELQWPPVTRPPGVRLARDLWRDCAPAERHHAGLKAGSTAIQFGGQSEEGQGLTVRARNAGWTDAMPPTDEGHIDWLLVSHEYAKACPTRVEAVRVGVATEFMVPPLPPQDPRETPGLPPGGKVFPSDHYPVWADVKFR